MKISDIINQLNTTITTAISSAELAVISSVHKYKAEHPDQVAHSDYPFVGISASDNPVDDAEIDPTAEGTQERLTRIAFGIWSRDPDVAVAYGEVLDAEDELRALLRKEENRITSDGVRYVITTKRKERFDFEHNEYLIGMNIVCEYRELIERPEEY